MNKRDKLALSILDRKDLIDKFWSLVDKTGECWLWKGAIYSNGYGQFFYGIRSHRFSFILEHKRLPCEIVRHKCDNKRCVNPSHLVEGTQMDNVQDRVSRDRSRKHDLTKTHCQYGHEYSVTGFYINTKNGSKMCKKCILISNKRQNLFRQGVSI